MKQMKDFDAFTFAIAEGDPIKREALENGNIRDYWQRAEKYASDLVMAQERAKKVKPQARQPILKRGRRG